MGVDIKLDDGEREENDNRKNFTREIVEKVITTLKARSRLHHKLDCKVRKETSYLRTDTMEIIL